MIATIDPGNVAIIAGAVVSVMGAFFGGVVLVIKALRNQPTNTPPAS